MPQLGPSNPYSPQEIHSVLRYFATWQHGQAGPKVKQVLGMIAQDFGPCTAEDMPGMIEEAIRLGHISPRMGKCNPVHHPLDSDGWGVTVYKRRVHAVLKGFFCPLPLTGSLPYPRKALLPVPKRNKDIAEDVTLRYLAAAKSHGCGLKA